MHTKHVNFVKLVKGVAVCAALSAVSTPTFAEESNNKAVEPDNSQVNRRDDRKDMPTADSQVSASSSDVELIRKIRASLTRNDSLSTYGKNVKILAADGTITLRGPVKSVQEKSDIESAAKTFAGVRQVKNELEIAR